MGMVHKDMKKMRNKFKNKIALALIFLFCTIGSASSSPVWTFVPLTATSFTMISGSTEIVQYTVTNQSLRPHILFMQPITGITQVTDPGLCSNPIELPYKGASCTLSLLVDGGKLTSSIHGGPNLCQQGGGSLECYHPGVNDLLDIYFLAKEYTIGGTVSGLTDTVTLLNNGDDAKIINNNGAYTFSTPLHSGSSYNVTVGTQPSGQVCAVSNGSGTVGNSDVTNVNVNCTNSTTTLSVNTTHLQIPATLAGSQTVSLTVTNTGSVAANNVHVQLPNAWSAVNQNNSQCTPTLAPGNSCNLIFYSTLAYIAEGSIPVTGDNVITPPNIAIAFTVQGYLVWAVSGITVQVIDTAPLGAIYAWWTSFASNPVPSTNDNTSQGLYDGKANTLDIVNTTGSSNTAAINCYNSTNGGFPVSTWYLPSLCQTKILAGTCTAGTANYYGNLANLGFGNFFGIATADWTSTHSSSNGILAWILDITGNITQSLQTQPAGVICAASLNIT